MTRVRQPKDIKSRAGRALATAALGTRPGTEELLQVVIAESKGVPVWRPTVAALQHALADQGERVWMTTAEFTAWHTEQVYLRRRRKDLDSPKPHEAVGLGVKGRNALINGRRTPSKLEALACAHYAAGYALPAPEDDQPAFAAWFYDRFGAVERVAHWLDIQVRTLQSAVQGYRMEKGERWPTSPSITLLRALDWVDRMGPICPYGERVRISAAENQEGNAP